LEDAANDCGLRLINATLAVNGDPVLSERLDDVVPIAVAAARFAGLDASAQAAPGLVGEVLQEDRVQRSLEADVKLGDLAFGQGDHAHLGEAQALEDRRGVLLVTGKAVERFRQDEVEVAGERILQELLHARSEEAGTRHAVVGVVISNLPALLRGELVGEPDLILDRGSALQVG
jgi:hypothetical protein